MRNRMRERGGAAVRGLLVLAAAVLLPLAATLSVVRPVEAQATAQDALWVGARSNVGVCVDPASAGSLSVCFSSVTSTWTGLTIDAVASDGVNVYFAGEGGGLSCPIADLGANCVRIMAGPWPQKYAGNLTNSVNAIAASDGVLWIGQQDGQILRCPANLSYASQDTAPTECVVLDDAGQRRVDSLLLASGRLYAGLGFYGAEADKQGLLWTCDPETVNACSTLDSYGEVTSKTLVAGNGYHWAGLENGIIWRCDPDTANACSNWDTAANWVNSLSYDGEGTLYAAIQGGSAGVIWSCPTASANDCSALISNVDGQAVAAGAGSVFSSTDNQLRYGTSPYTAASASAWNAPVLLYLPPSGPTGVGTAQVAPSADDAPGSAGQPCRSARGGGPKVKVTLRGPNELSKSQQVGLCALLRGKTLQRTFSLLDPGSYEVTARTRNGAYEGQVSLTVEQKTTTSVNLHLASTKSDG